MKKRGWPRSFLRLTEEYVGGILAGLGLGILLTGYIHFRRNIFELGELVLVAFALIPIGASIARHGQNKKEKSQNQDGEKKESTPEPRLQ